MQASDKVLQKTSYAFDASVWELYWTLLCGATIMLARPYGQRDPEYLLSLINDARVTIIQFVPSMLRTFLDYTGDGGFHNNSVRHVLCGGEELSMSLLRQAQQKLPHVKFHNIYGPTESASDVAYYAFDSDQAEGQVPIGRPISNTQIYILDVQGQPVPIGVSGEIHIAEMAWPEAI